MNDGRNIDPELGTLLGEGAQMDRGGPEMAQPLERVPAGESTTYYDLPVVKAPPWKPFIPAYFYVGGTAGAALVIAAAASFGGRDLRPVVVRGRLVGVAGIAFGSLLLIADLGRPSRFYNMLRVFRPTSPLNVGTWLLGGAGTSAALSLVAGDGVGVVAGAFGAGVSTYTAVVLSNTAIPVWSRGSRSLPFLFMGSALASAAAILAILHEHPVVRRLSVAGAAVELVAAVAYERELGDDRVRAPLRRSKLWQAAKVLGVASLATWLLPRTRGGTVVAATLATASALAIRFAVVEAGKASAADPRATFEPQRRGV